MKRLVCLAFLAVFTVSGCAEFDGYYDDDFNDTYKRRMLSETRHESTDREGAYGGAKNRD